MRWIYKLPLRLRSLFRKKRVEEDLNAELRFHLEKLIEENVANGMSAEEARYAALREFGGMEQLKEECRDSWGVRMIGELSQDVRYGLRQLQRNPGFSAVAVITLALGIGGTTAIFSVLHAALLNPWPYRVNIDRLAVLVTQDSIHPQRGFRWAFVPPAEFQAYKEQNMVFDQMIGTWGEDVLVTGRGIATDWTGIRVTSNTFQVLGVAPIMGRTIMPDDARPGAPPVVVLSYKGWQSRLGGDPDILGKTLTLNHEPTTVIGVMPRQFLWGANGVDCWLPGYLARGQSSKSARAMQLVGHLKPGVTVAQASSDFRIITKRLASIYPKTHPKGVTFTLKSFTEASTNPEPRKTLGILMGGVALLLLIACVNVANLLLARATNRQHEIAIRAALGASRGRLIRQLMIESLLLAISGSILGCAIARKGLGVLSVIIPPWYVPAETAIRMNLPVLLFAGGVAVVSTIFFGLAPAVFAVKRDLQAPLKASSHTGGESRGRHRLRNLLVVSEVTLSLVLLTGAGLILRSFWQLRHLDLGYNASNVLNSSAALPPGQYKTAGQRNQFYHEVLQRVRTLPGVVSAALGWPTLSYRGSTRIEVKGQPSAENQTAWYSLVGDRFFVTLGIPLLAGRTISEADMAQKRHVAVVNRAFVKRYFAGANALGQQVKVRFPPFFFPGTKEMAFEIVGVVGDTMHAEVFKPTVEPQVFLPITVLAGAYQEIFVRTAGDPALLVNTVRKEFAAVDKDVPPHVVPSGHYFRYWYVEPRFLMGTLSGFALLAMALVCIGVYSVLSYAVSQRTQEFGVRMALGAQVSDVRRMVMAWGLRWLAIGIGIGIPASIALEKVLRNRIWGIKSADPLTLLAVSLVLTAVGLVACYIPARRAAKVDPMVALRYE